MKFSDEIATSHPRLMTRTSRGSPVQFMLAGVGVITLVCFLVYLLDERQITFGGCVFATAAWALFLSSFKLFPELNHDIKSKFALIGLFGLLNCLALELYLFEYPKIGISQYSNYQISSHDSVRYLIWAQDIAEIWKLGGSYQDADMSLTQIGLPLVYATLFLFFGSDPAIVILFNVLMTGLAAVMTYVLAGWFREQWVTSDDRTPLFSSVILLLFPLVPIGGAAIPMKEASVLFLMMLGVVSVESLARTAQPLGAVGLVCASLGMLDMRFYMLIPLGVYLLIRLKHFFSGIRLGSLLLVIFLLVAAGIVVLRFSESSVRGVLEGESDEIRNYLTGYDESGSITASTFWRGNWFKVYLIPFRALLIPFNPTPPVNFEDYHVGAESANVIFLALLMPFILLRFQQVVKRMQWNRLAYVTPLIVGLLVISAALQVCSPRFLIPLLPFVAILAAQGIVYCRRQWQKTYAPLLVLFCFVTGIAYVALKAFVSGGG